MLRRSLASLAFAIHVCLTAMVMAQSSVPFYIGSYTGGRSQGIYRSTLDLASGHMTAPKLVARLENPSFLCIHPSQPRLYAVSEVGEGDRQVVAFTIEDDGGLSEINQLSAEGSAPCYVSVDDSGKYVFVANYSSGNILSIALDDNGGLREIVSNQQHEGRSVNQRRQQGPHAHCVLPDPSNNFVCAANLGLDQVLIYEFDQQTGALRSTEHPLRIAPGGGPRHLTFHPDGKYAFVLHEMTSKVTALKWDHQNGKLFSIQTLSTLPADFETNNSTAEVLVHPNGRFVYVSNRGHDSIAVFEWNVATEQLKLVDHTPSGGKTPRNFRLNPSGEFLLTQNQNSNSIFAFRVDATTGRLEKVGNELMVGNPCCIKFYDR